jgi:hypothetical protein
MILKILERHGIKHELMRLRKSNKMLCFYPGKTLLPLKENKANEQCASGLRNVLSRDTPRMSRDHKHK